MFIGASNRCKEFCEEEDKRKFDKYHENHRHTIFEAKTFMEDNKDFMRKSKRAWNTFQIRLESFFKKLKNQIDFIENEALDRLEYQEVKTAISTNDKYLAKITTDIIQERYRNLSCQDIDQFLQLRKQRQHSYIDVSQEEYQFASDIVKQLKETFKEICHDFKEQSFHQPKQQQPDRSTPKPSEDIPKKKQYIKNLKPEEQKMTNRYKREPDRQSQESRSTNNRQRYGNDYNQNQRGKNVQNKSKLKEQETEEVASTDEKRDEGYCPTLTIKQLSEANKSFNIQLKLMNFLKKLGHMQVWRVSDETGEIKLMISSHRILKGGITIKLTNCYVRAFNRCLEVCTKATSTISSHNFKEEQLKHYKTDRSNRSMRYDRSEKEQSMGKNLTKIDEIEPQIDHIKFIAKVIRVESLKNNVTRCVLGDETGIVTGEFQGFESLLKEDKILYFRGVQAKVDSKGHLYLTGRKILMQSAYDGIKLVNESNNISARQYEQVSEQVQK